MPRHRLLCLRFTTSNEDNHRRDRWQNPLPSKSILSLMIGNSKPCFPVPCPVPCVLYPATMCRRLNKIINYWESFYVIKVPKESQAARFSYGAIPYFGIFKQMFDYKHARCLSVSAGFILKQVPILRQWQSKHFEMSFRISKSYSKKLLIVTPKYFIWFELPSRTILSCLWVV
jgi:hypothetical protein